MNKDITLEDLGYEKIQDDDILLVYEIKNFVSDTDKIIFYKNTKVFEIFTQSDSPFTPPQPQNINMQELQAIYNKCKGMRWLDE